MNPAKPNLRTLFTSVFKISAFTFGGGYVIVPLMRKRFSQELGWVNEDEMLDMIAIGQSAPGPIAVNTSIMLGYRLLGVPGALMAVLGTSLPPLIILSLVTVFYDSVRDNKSIATLLNAMRAGVAAVIADVVWTMGGSIFKMARPLPVLLMVLAFLAVWLFRFPIILVLIFCGVAGFADTWIRRRQKSGGDGI
ncbi:MAG: chromate transporter [Clostridiales bacterium]|nr:chromate transporter [Clostridiales bacterium]